MNAAHYVFAGGGTGGHLFPGLAVAHAVRALDPAAAITFFTTTRPLDRELIGPTGFAQVEQPVRPATLHPLRLPAFWSAWRRSVAAAKRSFAAQRPAAVLGLGGYAAGPPVVAARRMGIRTAILNPDVVPGLANWFLARYADLIVLQFDASRQHFGAKAPCRTLGCPIRAAFANADASRGRVLNGLDGQRPLLLVTGASQGARSVNESMIEVWPAFVAEHPEWQLLHLSGKTDFDLVRRAYEQRGVPAVVLDFTHEMPHVLAAADVVVSRAGASTLAELTALGKPSILLPYPHHRDNHQRVNAAALADRGAAILLDDGTTAAANREPLLTALRRLASPHERRQMSGAAAVLGRPHAARAVAQWMTAGE